MFHNLLEYPIESRLLRWQAKVVVRDHEREARLFVRILLTGTKFPIFNSIAFVRVGTVKARSVDIADDGLQVRAYFDSALPPGGRVEFGYDEQALLRFPEPYEGGRVTRLDMARLPEKLRYQDALFETSRPGAPRPR